MRALRTLLLAALVFATAAIFAAPATAAPPKETCAGAEHPINDAEELAFLEIINAYRKEHGLRALTISTNLNREALWMARDMAANRYFGHHDSLGRHPWVRSVDCGYPVPAGENLAAGWKQGGAQAAFELFRGSPSHNENMLGRDYRQVGIARYWDGDSVYGWYWATEFGTTDDGTSPTVREAAGGDPLRSSGSVEGPTHVIRAACRAGDAAPAAVAGSSVSAALYQLQPDGSWRHFGAWLPGFTNTLDPADPGDGPCWLVSAIRR